jgi:hypothetical protein
MRAGSSKCGEGRRARAVDGFWALVPLVLRREDFEGEKECDGGCLGRDILRRVGDYMVDCMAMSRKKKRREVQGKQ